MNLYRILMGKPDRRRLRWKDNIKMDVRDMDWLRIGTIEALL
jgi:hypothetical protein